MFPFILTLALAQAGAASVKPSEVIAAAHRDARALGLGADGAQYLDFSSIPAAEKKLAWQVISAHCNSLSRNPRITTPLLILADGRVLQWPSVQDEDWPNLLLARVRLGDYRWSRDAYERLAEQDFHYHARVTVTTEVVEQVYWKGGTWEGDGKYYAPGNYPQKKKKQVTQTALAPWLAASPEEQARLAELVSLTGSQVPVLKAENFYWQTGIALNRTVGYYGLLEVKNRADYFKLIGFDPKVSLDFSQEMLAAVAEGQSGVAIHSRRLARFEKVGGAEWVSYDNDKGVDKQNPLAVLDKKNFVHKAEEHFGHLPNKMWAVFLCDAQGNRQDTAPDFVGQDDTSHSRDFKIHVGVSCFRCHTTGGLRDIKDWVRRVYRPPLQLVSPDYKQLDELQQLYFRSLARPMNRDRELYAEALFDCNGLKPEEYAAGVRRFYAYVDRPVSLEQASRELGVTPLEFRLALLSYLKVQGFLDSVLAMYGQNPNDQDNIPRDAWHERIALAHQILASYQGDLKRK